MQRTCKTVLYPLMIATFGLALPAMADTPMCSPEQVNTIISKWAERPRLGATQMIAKYGQPQEATPQRLIWTNPGPFKRICVFNLETPHDFPLPHVDYIEHTIVYNVPQDKVADLIAFDGSSTINRTVGELSARCDLEGHNVLTLNLDHDIVMGTKTVEQARQAFGENVALDVQGKHPLYVDALQFKPVDMASAAFPDRSVIPGAPQREAVVKAMSVDNADGNADAEVLASVIAIDLGEVLAGAAAQQEKIGGPVKDFAKMMQEMHGAHMVKTMELATSLGVTPVITPAVEMIQKRDADVLGMLVPLDGDAFAQAYVDAMIKGHTEVLAMIDNKLMPMARQDTVKQHLIQTRAVVADHLEKAKVLPRAR